MNQTDPSPGEKPYSALREVAELAFNLNLAHVISRLIEICREVTGAPFSSLILIEGNDIDWEHVLTTRKLDRAESVQVVGAILDRGLAGWVNRHKIAALIADTRADERWLVFPNDTLEVRSAICMPFLEGDRVLAILTLKHPEVRHFSEHEVAWLNLIASQGAIILRNAQLFYRSERQQRQLHSILRAVPDILFVLDGRMRFRLANGAALRFLGVDTEETLIGRGVDDQAFGEGLLRRIAGTIRGYSGDKPLRVEGHSDRYAGEFAISISRWEDPSTGEPGFAVLMNDITSYRELSRFKDEIITGLQAKEPLTGLLNRETFYRTFAADDGIRGLLLIQIENVDRIQLQHGSRFRDFLLRIMSERIKAQFPPEVIIGHIDTGKFAVAPGAQMNLEAQARALAGDLKIAVRLEDIRVEPALSIGGAAHTPGGAGMETMRRGEAALFTARENNGIHIFEESGEPTIRRLKLEQELDRAIENGEFFLNYQPQISIRSGAMSGVEALIRWRDGSGNLISPVEFIPVAEQTGSILGIDQIVIQKAFDQLALWREKGLLLKVSFNLSAGQFGSDRLVPILQSKLNETKISPSQIELEITEHSLMRDLERAGRVLSDLRNTGIRVAIDDFGTGYSSLGYLSRLPVDTLKIDRSFVIEIGSSSSRIVEAIIELAHRLGMSTIAEGVETEDQYRALENMGCDEIQGFYFSRPLSADDLIRFQNEMA